jgi:DNA-binding transcriptional LysR family regulator
VFGRSPERYERRTLFEERLVWVMRRDHPRAGEPLTIRTLMEVPHLIVSNADNLADGDPIMNDHGLQRRLIWDDGGAYLRAVGQTGAPRPRIMTTPDSVTLLAIVARSDMAALAPLRMAQFFREPFGLTLFDPPYEAPPMGVDVIWRRDHGAHPAVQWLIDLMVEEAGRIG